MEIKTLNEKNTVKDERDPTIGMLAFFDLSEVKAQQEIQKQNPYGSEAHRNAFNEIVRIAKTYGAEKWFPRY
jgi:hypothetical protein